ncbi:MAG: methyltransferase [Pseudomonadota bacterium]
MADTTAPDHPGHASGPVRVGWVTRLVASPAFQSWAARFPLTRPFVRREGEAMFDLVAGFCHAQILQAVVAFQIPQILMEESPTVETLAHQCAVPIDRMQILLRGAAAIGLLKISRGGRVRLTTRGAALAGVPGLQGMIAHHDVLYRDLADPVAFFKGETETELAHFWPYVFGADGAKDPDVVQTYSALMSDSQSLVAEDTLATIKLHKVAHLMDVGGGTGAFLAAAGQKYRKVQMTLFDLPAVLPAAQDRFAALGLENRTTITPGSFRDDPLPQGADMISLVRVLYDHSDATVMQLLKAVHDALPVGGQVLVSEPMTGGDQPKRAGDAYFALYCLAMRTGRARSAQEIGRMLNASGFYQVNTPTPRRAFVTSVVTAVKGQ